MRRTSLKTFAVSIAFALFGIFAMSVAENYYPRTNLIRFSTDVGRPWNYWDYLSTGSFVVFVSLLFVSLMFADKDD